MVKMHPGAMRPTDSRLSWERLCTILRCPDDGQHLEFSGSEYSCRTCSHAFPVLFGRIADLRPRSPQRVPSGTNPEFAKDYVTVFHQPLEWNANALGFGARESIPQRLARRKERQALYIQRILEKQASKLQTFCDFSAGAGYYTLHFASAFPVVLHCDLSCDSLVYASLKAEKLGIDNIAFLRIDYLKPPFAATLDCAICMDSLERGEGHERMLLEAIRSSLHPAGVGVVDFHNWWHNPVRRLGLLPENYRLNRSYSRRDATGLVRSCGIDKFQYFPFYQEVEPTSFRIHLAKAVLAPTRHVFLFKALND